MHVVLNDLDKQPSEAIGRQFGRPQCKLGAQESSDLEEGGRERASPAEETIRDSGILLTLLQQCYEIPKSAG